MVSINEIVRRSWKNGTVLVIGAGLALSLAGCTTSSAIGAPAVDQTEAPPYAGDFLNEKQMGEEFLVAARNFPLALPSGIQFPTQAPANAAPDTYSEPGVGEGMAVHYWRCAWERSYLDANEVGDLGTQTLALENIAKFESLDFVKEHVVDPERGWYQNVIVPASNGDASGVQQDYSYGGCSLYISANSIK